MVFGEVKSPCDAMEVAQRTVKLDEEDNRASAANYIECSKASVEALRPDVWIDD